MDREKTCPRCGEAKALTDFGQNARMRDGLQIHCRPCRAEIQREYRDRYPEKSRKLAREQKRRLAGDPEYIAYRAAQRVKYAEKIAEYNAQYYGANREAIRDRGRAWSAANPDRYRDPELGAKHRAKRRALLASVPHEPYTRGEIILRDEGRCGLCGEPVMGPLEIDHIVPISRGGPDTSENVRLTHKSCNRRKHITLDEDLEWLAS